MSHRDEPKPGDQARASILVRVEPEQAFRVFTEEIDQWWRRGLAYRVAGKRRGVIALEPRVGGRLFESFEKADGREIVIETGRVTVYEPPARLVLRWRNVNFSADEETEVEVLFAPSRSGTRVTVTHRGWSAIRPDHPARHGNPVAEFLAQQGLWWADQMRSFVEVAETAESATTRE